jgi:hypothetical protein
MADETRALWTNFLLEKQGHVYEVFPSEAPLLAELSGYDNAAQSVDRTASVKRIDREMAGNRETFSGKYVKHPIILAGLPGGGFVQENSTWNVPQVLPTTEAHIQLVDLLVPFSITVDVERDSFNNSMATAVETLIDQARSAAARLENLAMLGDGTGLVAQVTDSATSLATTVIGPAGGTQPANFDVLLPGTVWDVRTRSTGADPGQGLRRKIVSVNETTGVITWDTAQQASDGGSGNIVHAATEGIYVRVVVERTAGSATAPGNLVVQGLEQAAAVTGTFETIDKAANPQWRGTDGRAPATPRRCRCRRRCSTPVSARTPLRPRNLGLRIGDPAVIDLFKQGSTRRSGTTRR